MKGAEQTDTLSGTAIRFAHRSDDMKFGVLDVESEGARLRVTGNVCAASEGSNITVVGEWKEHATYGRQFHANSIKVEPPTNRRGIVAYLTSSLVEGIGPVHAERIYEAFKDDTLRVIREEPERVQTVKGVGKKRAQALCESIQHQVVIEKIAVWLFDHGIRESIAMKIYARYGSQSIETLKNNPYLLAEDFAGIGFLTADDVALKIGIEKDSPLRLQAAILHVLSIYEDRGHTMCLGDLLIRGVTKVLRKQFDLGEQLEALETAMKLSSRTLDGRQVFQRPYLSILEYSIAQALRGKREQTGVHVSQVKLDAAQVKAEIDLDEYQSAAAIGVCSTGLSILTGRPGTGKTSTLKVILNIFDEANVDVKLAAPTGKAAQRMGEATGREATTVHRLLGTDPDSGGFLHDDKNPLDAEVVVIDEASMLDTALMESLVTALRPTCQFVLVGDINQLGSVGPGRVLADIQESGVANVFELTRIHRQASSSAIIVASHAVIEGRGKDIVSGSDMRVIDYNNPQRLSEKLGSFILTQVAPKLEIEDVIGDIQILTGIHRGPLGTMNLNKLLARELNPNPEREMTYGGKAFGIGDKVIVTKNNYELEVFNGMLGRVRGLPMDVDEKGNPTQGISVDLDDGSECVFFKSDRDILQPAWALTVHKCQGSEFPFVIMIADESQGGMLDRNWLYTGISRAKRFCFLIGSPGARSKAASTVRSSRRMTLLKQRIADSSARPESIE